MRHETLAGTPRHSKKRIADWGKKLSGLLLAAALGFFSSSVGVTVRQLPDDLTVVTAGTSRLCTLLPTSVTSRPQAESADARLFGLFRLKTLNVSTASPASVQLGGTLFGMKMYSDGVMVVGLSDFSAEGRSANPARDAGIAVGDVVKAVNGRAVYTNAAFSRTIERSGGHAVTLDIVKADGTHRHISLTPAYSEGDGCLKTGMWVRDSAAGIGTLTYIDPARGTFGGLGHGICDSDTQRIVPIHGGGIVNAECADVRRGVTGAAGEIRGFLGSETLGEIRANTLCGTFGRYTAALPRGQLYDVAMKQEIRPGKAQMLCTVDGSGKPRFYDIVIDKVNYRSGEPAKNMIITVTDTALLARTGGIVQGMSGSPIVQDGKFVGAVTHVFINNPKCGYAIFAENMLRTDRSL